MRNSLLLFISVVLAATVLSACYSDRTNRSDALIKDSLRAVDSVERAEKNDSLKRTLGQHDVALSVEDRQRNEAFAKRYYSLGYNFVVKADTMEIVSELPEEELEGLSTTHISVTRGSRMAVMDIRFLNKDTVDSVWVQVALSESLTGWLHESELIKKAVPDDPISQFISIFSDIHLLVFLVVICLIAVAYLMRRIFRRNGHIVHFNDISSPYPLMFALLVAASATLYSTIQLFSADSWQQYYYHPTLNPFDFTGILRVFLLSVWLMLIVFLAVIDVVRHRLEAMEAWIYVFGLLAVAAVNYIVFTISTLYFIGYPLLAAYYAVAIASYLKRDASKYRCGACGKELHDKGICPNCGALNE